MPELIVPHGGVALAPRLTPEDSHAELRARAGELPQVQMSSRETSDMAMFAMGAYSPLAGFMDEADWQGVCRDMHCADGLFWPIPITLSISEELAGSISSGDEVALLDGETQELMGVMTVSGKYRPDKELECNEVFRTTDEAHPGVAKVMAQAPVNLGGTVQCVSEGIYRETYPDICLRPSEVRQIFSDRGWSRIAAFQTRNPMHRSHEYLVRVAIEVSDAVFIHQVLGKLAPGDMPAEVRVKAINALVENYLNPSSVLQGGYPIEMRYAGPREALLHAVCRQNFGCTLLIVGRDHAGVGKYYGPYDAQEIFDQLKPGDLQIQPLRLDNTFYCERTGEMATTKTSPSAPDQRLMISGTRLREMFNAGEEVPTEFSRPEVLAILKDYYANLPNNP